MIIISSKTMNIQIHREDILSVVNVPGDSIFTGFWAEYGEKKTIRVGVQRRLHADDYNHMMNLAVKRLREYGFNAHRDDPDELRAFCIVHPPGVKPNPQTQLGEDGIYHNDCTNKVRRQFIEAMHSGEIVKIDEPLWSHYLDLLRPRSMDKRMVWEEKGERRSQPTDFIFAGGSHPVAFWQTNGQHFCMEVPANAKLV